MLKIGQYFLAMLPGMWREEEEIDGRGSLGQLGLRKVSIYFLVFFFLLPTRFGINFDHLSF